MLDQAVKALEILENEGFGARIAGGAVRDLVQGKTPKDFDIATTATPDKVLWVFETKHNFNVIPTGLQHGTVTVVIDDVPLEITTLRIDKKTDGRHAEVEFVDDWRLDAARRDFTFNAMYMDKDGHVFDYFDGIKDLNNGYVRFVGDADARIKEDYLRILRFFRFHSRMRNGHVNDIPYIVNNRTGLEKISGERIWMELKKILESPNCFDTLQWMSMIIPEQLRLPRNGLYKFAKESFTPDIPILLKLIAFYGDDRSIIQVMKDRFKASDSEINYVQAYFMFTDVSVSLYDILLYGHKKEENFKNLVSLIKNVKPSSIKINRMEKLFQTYGWFHMPKWPVVAQELIDEGFVPGKELGLELEKRRKKWLDSHF